MLGMNETADVAPPTLLEASRWGLRGDLSWRLLRAAVQGCPWYLERALIGGWAGIIGLLAHEPRRALAKNLRALGVKFPNYAAWRTFQEIGAVSVDSIRAQTEPTLLQWEVEGRDHLVAAKETNRPVIVWTAHMGSYDAAAAFFAHRIGATLHAVRKPERNSQLQAIRSQDLRDKENEHLVTLYSGGQEENLGVELLRILKNGQWVALQADRALEGLSTMQVAGADYEWKLPRGPFYLALMAQAVCLPLFVRRIGPRHYGVKFHPPA